MKLRFRQSTPAERAVSDDPFSMFDVTAEALTRRVSASYHPSDIFPGFATSYSEGRLRIQKDYSPAIGERVTLAQSAEGVWTLEHQTWRPGTELEAHGASILRTSVRPVSPTETGLREVGVCYRHQDGSVTQLEVTEASVLPPMTPEECDGFTQTLQGLLDSARG